MSMATVDLTAEAELPIPLDFREALLPHPGLSIHDFLLHKTPTRSKDGSLQLKSAPDIFTASASYIQLDMAPFILSLPMPSCGQLSYLIHHAADASIKGHHSLIYPTSSGSDVKLPLWILELWREFHEVMDTQAEWRGATSWLTSKIQQESGINALVFQLSLSVHKTNLLGVYNV
ncbi:hypothetical protein HGRIS_006789 [Hohenbuehelia grisea]|uniref:Uncharacterized protein n=1 Tax=Hohenbuehelia grisea TaxID=104357 RepID=A0ABR3JAM2_9AGAR